MTRAHGVTQPVAEDWFLRADWPAPAGVMAGCTTRRGGVSRGPWAALNLATHVGDVAADVQQNRDLLMRGLALPHEPIWLEQVHGREVYEAEQQLAAGTVTADAVFTRQPGVVCAVLTADCLPVLLASRDGGEVAAVHAGWRGLAAGIMESTLSRFRTPAANLLAWLGPAIGAEEYEIGAEVYGAFVANDPGSEAAFTATRPGHWRADLYALAHRRLKRAGLEQIFGGGFCTYRQVDSFFSYRRDGTTGRMASVIWRDPAVAKRS